MRSASFGFYSLALPALLALSACGKGEAPKPEPRLSAPEQAFPTPPRPGGAASLPAEAEVTASSGPVQLTLRVYKAKIKSEEAAWPEGRLWYQIELKNTGKNRILVTDKTFHDPWAIADASFSKNIGIWLELIGPNGKPPIRRSHSADVDMTGEPSLPSLETKEGAALQERLRKADSLQRSVILSDYLRGQADDYRKANPEPNETFWLEPGASTTTKPWTLQDDLELIHGKPLRQPISQFAELVIAKLDPPGKYRIRAVYNHYIPPSDVKKYRIRLNGSEVRLKTPFLPFEVLP